MIENCDISGWGRIANDGWGVDYDAAIYGRDQALKRVIVQRNYLHHPRSNSNNWRQSRVISNPRQSTHPQGPQTIVLWDSAGNHVFRYNTVDSDDTHYYNDIFGAGANFSVRGFPNQDSDIYGNRLSHCWDDAIESEGANCNVRIWGNYVARCLVGIACASTSIGPLYVWRNVSGVIQETPDRWTGAFLKTSNNLGGGRVFVFHNTILQPPRTPGGSLELAGANGASAGAAHRQRHQPQQHPAHPESRDLEPEIRPTRRLRLRSLQRPLCHPRRTGTARDQRRADLRRRQWPAGR